jgi:hypothetical protein
LASSSSSSLSVQTIKSLCDEDFDQGVFRAKKYTQKDF